MSEVYTGTSTDARIVAYLNVDDEKLTPYLPTSGDWKIRRTVGGGNLLLCCADQISLYGKEGERRVPIQYAILEIPLKNETTGDERLLIIGGMSTGGAGPYKTNLKASARIDRGVSYVDGGGQYSEAWTFNSEGGDTLSFRLKAANLSSLARVQGVSTVTSSADPKISRNYHYDKVCEMVELNGAGSEKVSQCEFSVEGSGLPDLGSSAKIVAVEMIPWYTRRIFQ